MGARIGHRAQNAETTLRVPGQALFASIASAISRCRDAPTDLQNSTARRSSASPPGRSPPPISMRAARSLASASSGAGAGRSQLIGGLGVAPGGDQPSRRKPSPGTLGRHRREPLRLVGQGEGEGELDQAVRTADVDLKRTDGLVEQLLIRAAVRRGHPSRR